MLWFGATCICEQVKIFLVYLSVIYILIMYIIYHLHVYMNVENYKYLVAATVVEIKWIYKYMYV